MKHLTFLTFICLLYSCNNSSTTSTNENPPSDTVKYLAENKVDTIKKIDTSKLTTVSEEKNIEPPLIVQDFCFFAPEEDIIVEGNKPKFDPNKPFTFMENGYWYEGKVCINYKNFTGFSPYNIPFVLSTYGGIAEIYVDGKKVTEYKGKRGEIFFRKKIALEGGYNRVPVKVVSNSGKTREGYIEINIETTPEQIEIKNK